MMKILALATIVTANIIIQIEKLESLFNKKRKTENI